MFSLGFQPCRMSVPFMDKLIGGPFLRLPVFHDKIGRSAGCARYSYINNECEDFYIYYTTIYTGHGEIDRMYSMFYDYEYGDEGRAYSSFDNCSNPADEVGRRVLRRLGDIRGKAWYIGERPKSVVSV